MLTDLMCSNLSLETRRLRLDLLYLYKILFGLIDIEWSSMFKFAPVSATRGHCYKLFIQRSRIDVRQKFFCNRVANAWNNLPAKPEHFRTYRTFKSFLSTLSITDEHL